MLQVIDEKGKEEIALKSVAKEIEKKSPKLNEPSSEYENLVKRIVLPHKKKSRLVLESDLERVLKEVLVLYQLCFTPVGMYKAAYAVHHSQIDDIDPLNFFVTAAKDIVINPVITRHTKTTVDSIEGCVTFSDRAPIIVPRWHKIEVEYVTIMVDPNDKEKYKLSSKIQGQLSGHQAFEFSHEVDHGNGKYIYEN